MLSSNERYAIVRTYEEGIPFPDKEYNRAHMVFHSDTAIKNRESRNRVVMIELIDELPVAEPVAEPEKTEATFPWSEIEKMIESRQQRLECLKLAVQSSLSENGTGQIIRRAAGYYSFVSRGEKAPTND